MKTIIKRTCITVLLFCLVVLAADITAQDPPSPPGEHGQNGNQGQNGAPIGGGVAILLGFGAAYGLKKLYGIYKESKNDNC